MTVVGAAPTPPNRRRQVGLGAAVVALVIAGIVLIAGVTGGGDSDAPVAVAAVTTADTAPATSRPPTPTTTVPPTTSTTSTTSSTTTTTTTSPPRQATSPIAPPTDTRGSEPLVQVGSIAIPAIGLDSAMFEGIRLTTLDHGPGHWPGSASPGQVGNVVVAGHRTSHGAQFRHVDDLVPGDVVTFTTADGVFDYAVTSTEVVGPEALWIIDPSDTSTATLFACHPPGSTRQRIVVHLALVQP